MSDFDYLRCCCKLKPRLRWNPFLKGEALKRIQELLDSINSSSQQSPMEKEFLLYIQGDVFGEELELGALSTARDKFNMCQGWKEELGEVFEMARNYTIERAEQDGAGSQCVCM